MELTLLTPQRKISENLPVDEVFATGFKGQLDILPGHANLVSPLEPGPLRWKKTGGGWESAFISTGILQIENQNITILAEVLEKKEEIDISRAKKAEDKARQTLEEGGLDDNNFRKYELKLKRAMGRQNC